MKIIKGEETYKLVIEGSSKPFGEIYYSNTFKEYVLRTDLCIDYNELVKVVLFIKHLKESKNG